LDKRDRVDKLRERGAEGTAGSKGVECGVKCEDWKKFNK